MVLFISMRREGRSLGELVRMEMGQAAGVVALLGAFTLAALAVGVREVEGEFGRGDLVACVAPDGHEVARGLCNYSADETRRIRGLPSARFAETLGYMEEPELIHRDNLVVV